MDYSQFLPTFVVTLREGFEAALVVGIVLACLKKADQTQLNVWVYQGIGAGITASLVFGLFLEQLFQNLAQSGGIYTPVIKELLTALFGLIAIIMLSWMLIWMTQQAKLIKSEVEGAIQTALKESNHAGQGVFFLVFIAVLREGFESVLFLIAKFQEDWLIPGFGALAGLGMAALLGFLLFQWGVKINLRLFFQLMGIFLLLIVGGLVIGVVKHLDGAVLFISQLNSDYSNLCLHQNASCFLGPLVWNGSTILPDQKFPGIILKALFGYRETIYLLQAIAYLIFLAIVGNIYFQNLQDRQLKITKK